VDAEALLAENDRLKAGIEARDAEIARLRWAHENLVIACRLLTVSKTPAFEHAVSTLLTQAAPSAAPFLSGPGFVVQLYFSTPVRKCQEHLVGQPRQAPCPLNATLDGPGL
jgi:hypothetical protein